VFAEKGGHAPGKQAGKEAGMPVAVQLFLDTKQSALIRHIWQSLADIGVSHMIDCQSVPHVTLAIWDEVDTEAYSDIAPEYAAFWTDYKFSFSHIGVFPSTHTIFGAPAVNRELVDKHALLFRTIEGTRSELTDYYVPGRWNPHCTLATEFDDDRWDSVFDICRREWQPFVAGVEALALVEFGNGPITMLHEHRIPS
jgi:2'-5' RNA ligase